MPPLSKIPDPLLRVMAWTHFTEIDQCLDELIRERFPDPIQLSPERLNSLRERRLKCENAIGREEHRYEKLVEKSKTKLTEVVEQLAHLKTERNQYDAVWNREHFTYEIRYVDLLRANYHHAEGTSTATWIGELADQLLGEWAEDPERQPFQTAFISLQTVIATVVKIQDNLKLHHRIISGIAEQKGETNPLEVAETALEVLKENLLPDFLISWETFEPKIFRELVARVRKEATELATRLPTPRRLSREYRMGRSPDRQRKGLRE